MKWAERNNIATFAETSALANENIDYVFEEVVRAALRLGDPETGGDQSGGFGLNQNTASGRIKKKSKCCK